MRPGGVGDSIGRLLAGAQGPRGHGRRGPGGTRSRVTGPRRDQKNVANRHPCREFVRLVTLSAPYPPFPRPRFGFVALIGARHAPPTETSGAAAIAPPDDVGFSFIVNANPTVWSGLPRPPTPTRHARALPRPRTPPPARARPQNRCRSCTPASSPGRPPAIAPRPDAHRTPRPRPPPRTPPSATRPAHDPPTPREGSAPRNPYGCSSVLLELGRGGPMCSAADWILVAVAVASWASVRPVAAVATV